jgi:hypothetical protein
LILRCEEFAMFEYSNLSQVARSRAAAERFALLAGAAEAAAERKSVRAQARVARRARAALAELA